MKPKLMKAGNTDVSSKYDQCQTPGWGAKPLLDLLPKFLRVWEPMAGQGNLARMIESSGRKVTSTDLLTGQNFFDPVTYRDHVDLTQIDLIMTNPAFSIKYAVIEECYRLNQTLGLPFALLLPLETAGADQAGVLFEKCGVEIVIVNPRINFKMPSHRTWEETLKPTIVRNEAGEIVYTINKKGERVPKRTSGAQFPTAWFSKGLNLGKMITWTHAEKVLQPWEITAPATKGRK